MTTKTLWDQTWCSPNSSINRTGNQTGHSINCYERPPLPQSRTWWLKFPVQVYFGMINSPISSCNNTIGGVFINRCKTHHLSRTRTIEGTRYASGASAFTLESYKMRCHNFNRKDEIWYTVEDDFMGAAQNRSYRDWIGSMRLVLATSFQLFCSCACRLPIEATIRLAIDP